MVSILVGILKGEAGKKSHFSDRVVVCSISYSVLRNKDVGHDASTTIDDTSVLCLISYAFILLDTILSEKLTMFVTIEQIEFILFVMAIGIRLLYTAS